MFTCARYSSTDVYLRPFSATLLMLWCWLKTREPPLPSCAGLPPTQVSRVKGAEGIMFPTQISGGGGAQQKYRGNKRKDIVHPTQVFIEEDRVPVEILVETLVLGLMEPYACRAEQFISSRVSLWPCCIVSTTLKLVTHLGRTSWLTSNQGSGLRLVVETLINSAMQTGPDPANTFCLLTVSTTWKET
jgi:hypothetical protein